MKGFPNQLADLVKLATGIRVLVGLVNQGFNPKDDGVFGEALVRAEVAGTGHTPIDVETYIRQQRANRPSNQSFRTTARGLRELYRLLGFIDDSGVQVRITTLGRQAVELPPGALGRTEIAFWRRVIRDVSHDGDDGDYSHPYQVLLRLVGQKPGISRDKCALALEATNDSPEELARILELADLPEQEIVRRIGETTANWNNAKKVLPRFAEQLQDVVVIQAGRRRLYSLADAPGRADVGTAQAAAPGTGVAGRPGGTGARAPRSSRRATSDTIARAGAGDRFDEVPVAPDHDPIAAAETARLLADRLRRHQAIVQRLALLLTAVSAELYEDPFDILALLNEIGMLVEVKTLNGTEADERDRVQEALSQLLYYEAFVTTPVAGEAAIHKIACFEGPVSAAHRRFLNDKGIAVIWETPDGFDGDGLPVDILGGERLQEGR